MVQSRFDPPNKQIRVNSDRIRLMDRLSKRYMKE
jgi:hypothetical protein